MPHEAEIPNYSLIRQM